MIRQAAFAAPHPMLKGALHCHTTRSDGRGTPEEVILKHAQAGYAFMAITDHRIYNYKNFASQVDMLIVPGMEIDRELAGCFMGRCYHTVSIGPSQADGNGFEQDERFEGGTVTGQQQFQEVLDQLHARGNLTLYCHPEWSNTPARLFDQLRGNFAMEIWNTGCAMENEMDTNAAYWDELLMQGQRVFGVATDDGHPMEQHCRGWVMVNAQRQLSDILRALKEGAFYSSCGPELYDFAIEDGRARVRCSPCRSIHFLSGSHPTHVVRAQHGLITEAEFDVPTSNRYLRASVTDEAGLRAWTNPIFLDE